MSLGVSQKSNLFKENLKIDCENENVPTKFEDFDNIKLSYEQKLQKKEKDCIALNQKLKEYLIKESKLNGLV